ncbi:syntaxin KNOLLE-like protein [Carex rostrata]
MLKFFINCRVLPKGSPSKNSQRHQDKPGRRGSLEIVFNQQLTRFGMTSLAASLSQAQRCFYSSYHFAFITHSPRSNFYLSIMGLNTPSSHPRPGELLQLNPNICSFFHTMSH